MYQLVADADDFLVVGKAAGIAVRGSSTEPTLIERVREDLNNPDLSLVHRVDAGTSGLLLTAKAAAAVVCTTSGDQKLFSCEPCQTE